jgi:Lon protease-like protein
MTERLPLFPLGTVLFPGLVLPLHIFEERYRQLVHELLDGPEPRRFGVIAIRKGRETGIEGVSSLYEVGCTATLRETEEHDDGGFDLVTVGTQRFRLEALDESRPYLQGDVEFLDEDDGESAEAGRAASLVGTSFRDYLAVLSERGLAQVNVPDLPDDPVLLSYLVAATMIIDLPDRQGLLAEPDSQSRLKAERAMLQRETTMLRTLTSRPAPDLRYAPYSPN